MRSINEIIVHCSATPEGRDFTIADITRWHKARGFRTIGYHFVVYRDGSVHAGRPLEQAGAHCLKHNKHSIGVCYIGGCATDGRTPKDTRTPEQKEALVKLLTELHNRFPHAVIHGHRDFAAKACPSFNATLEYKKLATAILLVFACIFLSACKSTQRTLEEKVDSTRLETASTSTTSLATDKFLQSLVLNIDSIVLTSLSMPQVSHADDSTGHIGRTWDISGSGACSGATLANPALQRTGTSLPRLTPTHPPSKGTKVIIHGLRLQSNTADSSSVITVSTDSSTQHSRHTSNVKAKEKKVPSARWPLSLIAIAAIVIAALAWLIRKGMMSS